MKTEINNPENSKIVITGLLTLFMFACTFFGIDVDDKTRADIAVGIGAISSVVITIFRVWYTAPK